MINVSATTDTIDFDQISPTPSLAFELTQQDNTFCYNPLGCDATLRITELEWRVCYFIYRQTPLKSMLPKILYYPPGIGNMVNQHPSS